MATVMGVRRVNDWEQQEQQQQQQQQQQTAISSASLKQHRFTMCFFDVAAERSFVKSYTEQVRSKGFVLSVVTAIFATLWLAIVNTAYAYKGSAGAAVQLRATVLLLTVFATSIATALVLKFKCLPALLRPAVLEITMSCFASVVAVSLCFAHSGYLAKSMGIDANDAFGSEQFAPDDSLLLLCLDTIVTATHLFLPVRWCICVPMELVVVGIYAFIGLTLNSWQEPVRVCLNLMMLTGLVVLSSFGRRALECRDRASFQMIAKERSQRYQVEHRLAHLKEPVASNEGLHFPDDDERVSATSGGTNELFSGLGDCSDANRHQLVKIAELGFHEHWLIDAADVQFPQQPEIIGCGTFGLVVPGLFHGLVVAVKTTHSVSRSLPVKRLGNIANELRILRRLRHPNIVLLHGALIDPRSSEIALVMEYVSGLQLDTYVSSPSASLTQEVRHGLLTDVCLALRYLHAQRPPVVHGDLKGANIRVEHASTGGVVSEAGVAAVRAKLLDFGLSRLVTKGGAPVGGTVAWMAPELLIEQRIPAEASADVFSFGRVVYLVVTGKQPLAGLTRADIVRHARNRCTVPPLAWPECPFRNESIALCEELLRFQPLSRPNIVAVSAALLAWRPVGSTWLAAETALAASDGGFKVAVQYARAQLLEHGQAAQCQRVVAECRDAGSHDNLFEPDFAETPDEVKVVMMLGMLDAWNCRVPSAGTGCCVFHALTACELRRLEDAMDKVPCDAAYRPYHDWQCPQCNVMDEERPGATTLSCMLCGYEESLADRTTARALSPRDEVQTKSSDDIMSL
eukprot:NODE_694_length_2825_cov_29.251297.p1 GENE.NODE_694_length_2825_cov_29.251297~~NODE_694_length_2825_cov_29.251297.p1  ORF type:complete len:799 (-),score=169.96 NODE_694_length_2825_cov_29.251297:323-2719(-)